MAITRYAGDRFTTNTSDTKPTGVLDGAYLIDTGNLTQYVRRKVGGTSQWSQLAGGGGGGGTPGGANTQVQFNNAGAFGASTGLTFDGQRLFVNNLQLSGILYDSNASDGENGMVLTNEGQTGVNWKSIESVLSGVGGSGVANYVARWSDEDTLTSGTIFDNGDVGIGTANPGGKLHVFDTVVSDMVILESSGPSAADGPDVVFYRNSASPADNDDLGKLVFRGRNDNSQDVNYANIIAEAIDVSDGTEDGALKFYTYLTGANTETMVLRSANVGIGTNDPSGKLHILQSGTYAAAGVSDAALHIKATHNYPMNIVLDADGSSDDTNRIRFLKAGTTKWQLNVADDVDFFYYNGSSWLNRFVIEDGGNVGIGTATPGTILHLKQNDAVGPTISLTNNSKTSYINLWGATGGGTDRTNQFEINAVNTGYGLTLASTDYVRFKTNGIAASDEAMRIDSNGNVGIGTNAPLSKFNVLGAQGNWRVDPDSVSNEIQVLSSNTANTGFRTFRLRTNETIFDTGGSERMRILSDGKVGIGTDAPATKLEVAGNLNLETSGGDVGLWLHRTDAREYRLYVDSNGLLNLRDQDAGATRMAFKTDGNLGIATTTPGAKLHVNGDAIFENNGSNINIKNTWSSGNHDINFIGSSSTGGSASNTAARIRCLATAPGGAATGSLTFTVNSGDTFVDALYIKEDGNIGIGTNAPAGKLEIVGSNGTVTGTPDGDAEELVIRNNDRAGIQILSANNGYGSLIFGSASDINGANIFYAPAATLLTIGTQVAAGEIALRTANGAEAVRIDANGSVGIGTNSPSRPLHVYGGGTNFVAEFQSTDDKASILLRDDTTLTYVHSHNGYLSLGGQSSLNANNLNINSVNGNVGINNTTPEHKLHVAGDAIISGYLYDSTNSTGVDGYVLTSKENGPQWKMIEDVLSGVGGNGTANYVPKWTDSDTLGNSIIYDDGDLGISTNSPDAKLHVFDTTVSDLAIFETNNPNSSNGPDVVLYRSSASPADADDLGRIAFRGRNDNSQDINYANIIGEAIDVSDGTEDGALRFNTYLTGASTETMVLRSANVGMGTNDPDAHLHIEKSAGTTTVLTEVAANSTVGYEIKKTGSTTQHWKIVDGQTANGYLEIYDATDSATRMSFNTNGNVGIGTVNAPRLLTIKGDSKHFGAYASDGSLSVLLGTDSDGDGQLLLADVNGTTKVLLEAEASAPSYINNGGSVGIGTNNPGEMLQVGDGSVNSTSIEINSASWAQLKLTSPNTNGAYIMFGDPEDEDIGNIFYYHGSNANYMSFTTNASEQMRIDKNGNVGIGTNSPTTNLHIRKIDLADDSRNALLLLDGKFAAGGVNSGDEVGIAFRVENSGGGAQQTTCITSSYQVNLNSLNLQPNGGNVGIGTNNPAKLLTVRSATSPIIGLYSAYADSNARNWSIGTNNAAYGDFTISASAANGGDPTAIKLSILKEGSVGIGTNAPETKLHVEGSNFVGSSIKMERSGSGQDEDAGLIFSKSDTATDGHRLGGIYFGHSGTNYAMIRGEMSGSAGGRLYIVTASQTNALSNTSTETVVIEEGTMTFDGALRPRVDSSYTLGTSTLKWSELYVDKIKDVNNSTGSANQILSAGGSGGSLDWVSLSEITGVDGSGTANTIPRWTDSDTIGDSLITVPSNTRVQINGTAASTFEVHGQNASGIVYSQIVNTVASAVGNGAGIELRGLSSTQERQLSYITSRWLDNTDASRKSRLIITTNDGGTLYNTYQAYGKDPVLAADAGNVGIGTNNPQQLLHINGSSPIIRFRDSDATGTPLAHIDASGGALKLQADSSDETASSFLTLEVDGSEHVRVIADGNVGIGTNNPAELLHVDGAGYFEGGGTRDGGWHRGLEITTENNNFSSLYFGGQSTTKYSALVWTSSTSGNVNNKRGAQIFAHPSSATNTDLKFSTNNAVGTSDPSIKMVIRGDGKVGIGTDGPDSKLEIAGGSYNSSLKIKGSGGDTGIQFEDSGGTTDGYIYAVDGSIGFLDSGASWAIQCKNDDYIRFAVTSNTEHMRIKSDGNVGIGTDDPKAPLHIFSNGSANTQETVLCLGSNTSNRPSLQFSESQNAGFDQGISIEYRGDFGAGAANGLTINGLGADATTSGAAIATFLSGGNVGIGTTAPTRKLEVIETTNAAAAAFETRENGGIAAVELRARDLSAPTVALPSGQGPALTFQAFSGTTFQTMATIFASTEATSANNDVPSSLIFLTTPDGSASATEKMRILSDGNVGIGTNAPATKLDIWGGTGARPTDPFSGQNQLFISQGGTANAGITISADNNAGTQICTFIQSNTSASAALIGTQSDHGATIRTNNTDRITIASDGDVDIAQNLGVGGAHTGAYKFYVHGNSYLNGTAYVDDNLTVDGDIDFESMGQYITFYGDSSRNHAITSRDNDGNAADDLRINSYGALYVNLDSNNNNSSGANFEIGKHGSTGSITDWLFTVFGETGKLKLHTYGSGTHTGTAAYKLSVDSSGNVIETAIGAGAVDGAGTANYITRWTDTDTIGNSNIFDNGTIGIGTAANLNGKVTIREAGNSGTPNHIFCMLSSAAVGHGAAIFLKTSTSNTNNRYGARIRAIRNANDNAAADLAFSLENTGATAVAEVVRFTSDGSVGIGTDGPAAQLQIGRAQSTSAFTNSFIKLRPSNTTNATGLTSITLGTSTVDNYGYSISGWRAGTDGSPHLAIKYHNNSAAGVDVMAMDSSGHVGIGTNDPAQILDVYETTSNISIFRSTATNYARVIIRSGSAGDAQLAFQNNTSTKWSIGNDGGDSDKFKIAVGSGAFAASEAVIVDTSGNLSILGTLTEASSLALKENIEDFTPSLDIINKIRPVKYNKKKESKKEIGLIAEELAELFPELVDRDNEGNPSGVNYSRAVTVLLGGFKELYKEVQELKKRI